MVNSIFLTIIQVNFGLSIKKPVSKQKAVSVIFLFQKRSNTAFL